MKADVRCSAFALSTSLLPFRVTSDQYRPKGEEEHGPGEAHDIQPCRWPHIQLFGGVGETAEEGKTEGRRRARS